jgi:hypothetical protein
MGLVSLHQYYFKYINVLVNFNIGNLCDLKVYCTEYYLSKYNKYTVRFYLLINFKYATYDFNLLE